MSTTWEQIKDFCARLFSRGRHGVETLSESLDRQARIQRLAGQARGLARERNTLITTIGKKVYALHGRGKVKNRDVLGDCLRIDEIREEIEKLKHQIEEIRLASMGELPEIELEDDSLLAEEEPVDEPPAEVEATDEEAEEMAPPEADGPAPEEEEAVCLAPAPEVDEAEGEAGVVEHLRGKGSVNMTTDEIMDLTRGDAERES